MLRLGASVYLEHQLQVVTLLLVEPGSKRSALESVARISVMADDIDALGSESLAARAHDLGAIVG